MQKSSDYIRNFVTIFFAQKNLIFGVSLLIIIGSVLFAFLYPPQYAASGSVILKGSVSLRSPESIEKVPSKVNTLQESDLFSEVEIINANVVIENAVDELMKNGFDFGGFGTPEEIRKSAVKRIKGNIIPEINPRSNTISIQTIWGDPEQALTILKTVIEKYFEYRSEIFKPKEAEDFFASQLKKFSDELEAKEDELRKLTMLSKTPNASEEIDSNLLNMKNLERQLFDLKQEYFDQKSRLDMIQKDLKSRDDSNYFPYIDDQQLRDMSSLVVEIIKKRNEEAQIFHPLSKKIQNYNKQIKEAMGTFRHEIGRYVEAENSKLANTQRKIQYLETQIEEIRNKNVALYDSSTRSKMLERQIAVLEDSYTTFTKRLEEAKISNNYKTNKLFTVSLLERPEAGQSPIFPNRAKVIPLGVLAGIVLGVAVGFLVEFFNHTFKTPEDVETNTDLSYIFSIPE